MLCDRQPLGQLYFTHISYVFARTSRCSACLRTSNELLPWVHGLWLRVKAACIACDTSTGHEREHHALCSATEQLAMRHAMCLAQRVS